jgi:hypothetical protein
MVTLHASLWMMALLKPIVRRCDMERFLERHQDRVTGVLTGFDRILFRGTLRSISYRDGLDRFMGYHRVLYKGFGRFAEGLSQRIKDRVSGIIAQSGRPYLYLQSSAESKEKVAQSIAGRDQITEGLICILGCVEPCQSFSIRRDAETKTLKLVPAKRKCLHYYFYYIDREFGLMHVRLESWLPFSIQVYVNGREYLARRLEKASIGCEKSDNCFTRIDDVKRAQEMLDALVTRKWERFLNMLARRVNPLIDTRSDLELHGYYWTIRQSEVATDVMFRDSAALEAIYPRLVAHAIEQFRCKDVLRFLGRRLTTAKTEEVTSELREFVEGVRIKHRVGENSIKMYDKQGSVLRIETTINNPRPFRACRKMIRDGRPCWVWLPMRKGLADIARRVEISRAANQRYLEALAVVDEPAPTKAVLDPLSQRVRKEGRSYRPLRPIAPEDNELFGAVLRGEHLLDGFRNRDIRQTIAPGIKPRSRQGRAVISRITRYLGLLRAHGLIRKVPKTQRYRITTKGHQVMTTALRLREIDVTKIAA